MSSIGSHLFHVLELKRLRVSFSAATLVFVLMAFHAEPAWKPIGLVALRVYLPALMGLLVYSFFEHWPRDLPAPLARWAVQVLAVTLVVPGTVLALFLATLREGQPPFWLVPGALWGFLVHFFLGALVSAWVAMAALLRQRDAHLLQAERARSELQQQALDAQLRLLQAQVEPHFLFNTLANVQALVDAGSPRASPVLASLIAYLRAAVPRLSQPDYRLGQELDMVRAYLALMQLRMPDRLTFSIDAEPGLEALRCPPLMLMTLVENAVRHGIDPSLEGGHIEVNVGRLADGRCLAEVRDTGVGLQPGSTGLGTGLQSLRERLQASFEGAAELRLSDAPPHGMLAEIEFPARS